MPDTLTRRREFLQAAAAAWAAPYLIPAAVLAAPGRPGANDRILAGVIGAGFRARDLAKDCPADLKLVAVADCDLRQIADYLAAVRKFPDPAVTEKCAQYQDYRQMLSDQKLDGVFVATPTHVRTLACLHAMQAGLDVYAEKPLTLTIEEGQYLVRAERKHQRVFQVGTQQRSIAINTFGSSLIRNGAIGKVLTVSCPTFFGPRPRPAWPSQPTPAGMNWDLWCHQTELIPFSSSLHPGLGKWYRYREYCGHGVTGWGAHAFDQVQQALGTDDTGPVEVWPEESGPDGKVSLRYANGTLLKLDLPENKGPRVGAIFTGEKGKIEINRNRLAANPPELIRDAPPPEVVDRPIMSRAHIGNWIRCMRTREKTAAPAAVGHRVMTICHLILICRQLGRKLRWDPRHEQFLGDEEANRLRSRPRRKGYELPEI
jgi:predicted dehydrogenase